MFFKSSLPLHKITEAAPMFAKPGYLRICDITVLPLPERHKPAAVLVYCSLQNGTDAIPYFLNYILHFKHTVTPFW